MTNAPLRIFYIGDDLAIYPNIDKNNPYLQVVDNADLAEVIIFENDDPKFIRNTAEFKKWPQKCICVNSSDSPTYFLPACYSSNSAGFLSNGRVKTIPYMAMQRGGPNLYIKPATDYNCQYLYAFKGGATSWVRKKLFKNKPLHHDVYIAESNNYFHWSIDSSYLNEKAVQQQEYGRLMEQSLFFLCPRGVGSSSIRLFEVMQAGRVPVIIADGWIPIEGFNWDEFSIRVAEKDISKIDNIIRANADRAETMGRKARQIYTDYFTPGPDLALLAKSLKDLQANRNENKEKMIRALFPIIENVQLLKQKSYGALKIIILKIYMLTGRKFPYSLNRPMDEQLQKK